MTAPFSHTQRPVRLTVSLQTKPRKGAPLTGPLNRALVIPQDGSIQFGRASDNATKNRRPAVDNALFDCAVMSRYHAAISAPNGPHGSIMLEDTGSMHGVYVNGRKIKRTEIFINDEIQFGSQVTRAEAVVEGVDVQITDIHRSGATFSGLFPTNAFASTTVTLPESSKTVIQPSYRVPDYDTDSSKEDLTCTTSLKPSTFTESQNYIDLDPISSPAHDDDIVEVDDFSDNISDDESHYDSEFDGHDYPNNPDEIDYDGESRAASDRSESPGPDELSNAWNEPEEDVVDSESDDSFETQLDTRTEPPAVKSTESNATDMHTQTQTQAQETDKPRDTAEEVMSIPWLVEPSITAATHEYYPNITIHPHSVIPKISSLASQKVAGSIFQKDGTVSVTPKDQKKDVEVKAIQNADDFRVDGIVLKEMIAGSQAAQAAAIPTTSHEPVMAADQQKHTAVPAPTAGELFHKVDSPTGSKRKRDTEDDGHEDTTATSTARRLFKFRLGPQHKNAFANFLPKRVNVKAAPRPIKKVKRSTAKVALSAFAGALGGVATVVGVLMTPQCEQLLANWPIQ